MPTIMRWRGYRFFFFSNEGAEPPHIHIDKDGHTAKVWLDPVAVARNIGYSAVELNEIVRKVRADAQTFGKAWDEHFGD